MPQEANIDLTKSEQYILSIRLSAGGFSFSIHNPTTDRVLYFRHKEVDPSLSLTINLKQAFRENSFLLNSFQRVDVIMESKRFTLLPTAFYQEEQATPYFYYNHSHRENEKILSNRLPKYGITVLFGIDKSVHSFLQKNYPNLHTYSQITPLLEHFSTKSRTGHTQKMYAHLRKKAIDVYCFERSTLQLVNTLGCTTVDDAIYYLLYTWKNLNMNQEEDELYILGEYPEKNRLLEELRRFVLQVAEVDPCAELPLSSAEYAYQMPFDMQVLLFNNQME